MSEIDLSNENLNLGSTVHCVAARWWRETSKCAVVEFEEKKNSYTLGDRFSLRLDLDKIAFLDHAKDATIDHIVQSKVRDIWERIMKKRVWSPSLVQPVKPSQSA
jgi:hypothetical protein